VPSRSSLQTELRTLGANIRRERTARGITQEKLAEKADLNLRTVQKIEAGDINILVTTVFVSTKH
jgi:transcriptional regulator with XRE-family HTH domain